MSINVASFNARGLKAYTKRVKVFEYFIEKKCDLIFIQEAHCTIESENLWKSNWTSSGDIVFSHSNDLGGGLMCLTNNKIDFSHITNIIPGRLQKLNATIYGHKVTFYNIH